MTSYEIHTLVEQGLEIMRPLEVPTSQIRNFELGTKLCEIFQRTLHRFTPTLPKFWRYADFSLILHRFNEDFVHGEKCLKNKSNRTFIRQSRVGG